MFRFSELTTFGGTLFRLAMLCLVFLCLGHSLAGAQTQPIDLGFIEGELERLGELDGLSDADREEAEGLLSEARNELTDAEQRTDTVDRYVAAASTSNETISRLRQDLSLLDRAEEPTDIPDTSVDLRNRLDALRSDLTVKTQRLVDLQSTRTQLAERATEISEESASSRAALDDLLEVQAAEEEDASAIDRARQTLLRARISARRAGIADLQRELASLPQRQDINTARISLLEAEIAALDRELSVIQQRLSDVRMDLADAALVEAINNRNAAEDLSANDQAIAEENIELATALGDLADEALIAEQGIRSFAEQTLLIRQQADTVERILATGRVTEEAGALLRQLRISLPRSPGLRNAIAETVEQRASLQLSLILWQDRLRSTQQLDTSVLIAGPDTTEDPSAEGDVAQAALSQSFRSHRERLLTNLLRAGRSLLDRLNEKEIQLTEALEEAQSLRNTLDRRLLWLPSNVRPIQDWGRNVQSSAEWLAAAAGNANVFSSYRQTVSTISLLPIMIGLFSVLVLINRNRLQLAIVELNDSVGKVARDKYLTTPYAVLACLGLALPIPALLLGLFVPGLFSSGDAGLIRSVAFGGVCLAIILFIALFVHAMSGKDGVLAKHFNWSNSALAKVRSVPIVFIVGLCIAASLLVASIASGRSDIQHGVGMAAFVVASFAIAALGYQAFEFRHGLVQQVITEGLSRSFLLLGFIALAVAPFFIGILPLLGYFDTAYALQVRVVASAGLLFLGALLYGILRRFFLIAQRRLALRKAIERREQMAAERDEQGEEEDEDDTIFEPLSAVEELEKERQLISDQTRRLVLYVFTVGGLAGLLAIWGTVLPALGVANDVVLWNGVGIIDGVQTNTPITLWNLLLFIILIAAGVVAAYNIGGLLEVGPFQLLQLSPGSRYAIRTIISYLFVGTGIIAGFLQLGVDWSRLQWIIAALGVGLGFGLQEIVANFISGLIILFERPVRVGDTVNIGELEGDVTNISIRATTIRDFDNREVLLPNKSIITENVTNWTLRDSIVRIIIDIGVAYGSDIETVREILIRIAEEENDVLDSPEPRVFFMSHGDSSLDFELRVFISSPRKRFRVRDELNTAINSAFTEAGIEIPFPQRDIHIKPVS
ncbi:MAG: mechanosensitive ion channel domain-containing protein [Pseudomonadota bacterium]